MAIPLADFDDPVLSALSGTVADAPQAGPASSWQEALLACHACPCRAEASRVVPGVGSLDATIMVLGRNPGREEDRRGLPFIGPAGVELDSWLVLLGLDRTKLWLTNTVKCHTLKDRPPLPREIQTCADAWLQREIQDLRHLQAILPVGREAGQALLGVYAGPPGRLQAYVEMIAVAGRRLLVFPLPHPSYILRARGKRVAVTAQMLPRIRQVLQERLPDAFVASQLVPTTTQV